MIDSPGREGTSQVKRSGSRARVKVSADGKGVVSHAGAALLRELATETGLADAVTRALLDTYRGLPLHLQGQVFADLAVAIADGADAVTGIGVLRDREALFGPVASMPTAWRLLDRIDEPHLGRVRAARAAAREQAWLAGAAPDPAGELRIDFDATISIAFSEKQNAAATWKKTFGFHPLLAFADRPEVAGGEALAGLLRPGNAGSNTAADHVTVLDMALAQLPEHARPRPGDPGSPRVLARSDSAGATHAFAAACRTRGVEFSFGFPVDERVQALVDLIPDQCWHPAIEDDGELRDGAWVAEATGLLDLSEWPTGSRVILRKERPHPGAQLTFLDDDGHRDTGFITDTPAGGHSRAAGRSGSATPAARPGRGPDPAGEGHRHAELPLPLLRRQQRLAGDRDDRDGPRCLDQAPRLRRRTRPRHVRDRDVPLPGAARRRQDHPQRPSNQTPDRPQLAVGRTDRPSLAQDPRRVRLNPWHHLSQRPETQPPQVEPASTRHDSRVTNHATKVELLHCNPSQRDQAILGISAQNRG